MSSMDAGDLYAYATLAYRFKCGEWATDFSITVDEYRERVEAAGRSLDRLGNFVQMVYEAEYKDGPSADFYVSILEKEFGFSPDMERPNFRTWWPAGLNHNIPAIAFKYAERKRKAEEKRK